MAPDKGGSRPLKHVMPEKMKRPAWYFEGFGQGQLELSFRPLTRQDPPVAFRAPEARESCERSFLEGWGKSSESGSVKQNQVPL